MLLLQSGKAADDYGIQCQFQLFVCQDRSWVDLSSYYPSLPQAIIRIERNAEFQPLLEKEVLAFVGRLEALYERVLAEGWSTQWKRLVKPLEPKPAPVSQSSILATVRSELNILNRTQEGK